MIPYVRDSAAIKKLRYETGVHIAFGRFEVLDNIVPAGDLHYMVSITTYVVRDLVRSTRYTKKGQRFYILTRKTVDARWYIEHEYTTWDEDFEEVEIVHYGSVPTMAEKAAKDEWEKLCYRPGNSAVPLDNYDRVIDGAPTDPAKMKRHYRPDNWNRISQ